MHIVIIWMLFELSEKRSSNFYSRRTIQIWTDFSKQVCYRTNVFCMPRSNVQGSCRVCNFEWTNSMWSFESHQSDCFINHLHTANECWKETYQSSKEKIDKNCYIFHTLQIRFNFTEILCYKPEKPKLFQLLIDLTMSNPEIGLTNTEDILRFCASVKLAPLALNIVER